jgi:TrmH family RNA methyltransferase
MVVGRSNETLKAIRRLRRRQGDHALLEGPHLLGEALAAGLEPESVLATPDFAASASGRRLLERLRRPPLLVDDARLSELADSDAPRGVLALARLPRPSAADLALGGSSLVLFLDGVQEPGNVGALARVAEAFGATALALAPGCAHPNHPRALRASAGSLLRLPTAVETTIGALDLRLLPHDPLWVALAAHGGEPPGAQGDRRPLVLALGAEGPGLSRAVEQRCAARWTIPLAGGVESLNVAVAAGVALFALSAAPGRRP